MAQGGKPKKGWRRWLKRFLVVGVVGYGAIVALMAVFQRSLIYSPVKLPPNARLLLPPKTHEISFTVDGVGRIFGIYHPPKKNELVVLLLHGNAENVLYYLDLFKGLVRLNVGVLMIDYPGYGKSEGSPTEETLYRSAERALEWLNREQKIPFSRVVLFGKSLGTGVATHLAAEHSCAALILESPFKSLASVGQRKYPFLPVSLVLVDRYEVLSRISRVGEPLLVIVAEKDSLVVPAESFTVYKAAAEPKTLLVIKDADHGNIQSVGGDFYWQRIKWWLENFSKKTDN